MLSVVDTALSAEFLRKTEALEAWHLECNRVAACGADGDLKMAALLSTKTKKENLQMKRLLSTMACAAALCGLGASAHASIPVKMAPVTSQANYVPVVSRVIVIVLVYYVDDLPQDTQDLAHVDQAAEFDRTT
jgi:hypothetical protein